MSAGPRKNPTRAKAAALVSNPAGTVAGDSDYGAGAGAISNPGRNPQAVLQSPIQQRFAGAAGSPNNVKLPKRSTGTNVAGATSGSEPGILQQTIHVPPPTVGAKGVRQHKMVYINYEQVPTGVASTSAGPGPGPGPGQQPVPTGKLSKPKGRNTQPNDSSEYDEPTESDEEDNPQKKLGPLFHNLLHGPPDARKRAQRKSAHQAVTSEAPQTSLQPAPLSAAAPTHTGLMTSPGMEKASTPQGDDGAVTNQPKMESPNPNPGVWSDFVHGNNLTAIPQTATFTSQRTQQQPLFATHGAGAPAATGVSVNPMGHFIKQETPIMTHAQPQMDLTMAGFAPTDPSFSMYSYTASTPLLQTPTSGHPPIMPRIDFSSLPPSTFAERFDPMILPQEVRMQNLGTLPWIVETVEDGYALVEELRAKNQLQTIGELIGHHMKEEEGEVVMQHFDPTARSASVASVRRTGENVVGGWGLSDTRMEATPPAWNAAPMNGIEATGQSHPSQDQSMGGQEQTDSSMGGPGSTGESNPFAWTVPSNGGPPQETDQPYWTGQPNQGQPSSDATMQHDSNSNNPPRMAPWAGVVESFTKKFPTGTATPPYSGPGRPGTSGGTTKTVLFAEGGTDMYMNAALPSGGGGGHGIDGSVGVVPLAPGQPMLQRTAPGPSPGQQQTGPQAVPRPQLQGWVPPGHNAGQPPTMLRPQNTGPQQGPPFALAQPPAGAFDQAGAFRPHPPTGAPMRPPGDFGVQPGFPQQQQPQQAQLPGPQNVNLGQGFPSGSHGLEQGQPNPHAHPQGVGVGQSLQQPRLPQPGQGGPGQMPGGPPQPGAGPINFLPQSQPGFSHNPMFQPQLGGGPGGPGMNMSGMFGGNMGGIPPGFNPQQHQQQHQHQHQHQHQQQPQQQQPQTQQQIPQPPPGQPQLHPNPQDFSTMAMMGGVPGMGGVGGMGGMPGMTGVPGGPGVPGMARSMHQPGQPQHFQQPHF